MRISVSKAVMDTPKMREREMLIDKKYLRKTSMELVQDLVNARTIEDNLRAFQIRQDKGIRQYYLKPGR